MKNKRTTGKNAAAWFYGSPGFHAVDASAKWDVRRYELVADDITVWKGEVPPTQDQIDRSAKEASGRGWNGTTLDLRLNHEWLRYVYPSESAFL